MAFTLSTIYKAVDKMTPVLKQMERANSNFAAKQDAAYRKLKGTMSNMSGQLLSLAGGLSVGSLLYTGTSAVVKFDESLNSLSAITGIVGKDFEVFKKEVIEVANRTKKAGYEVSKAFELVGSAQPELLKDAKALSQVTEAAIVLSKASKDNLEVSARNVTGILNQFGHGADQANRAINLLSAGSVVGAANISEITESMKNSGTVMADANFTMEQGVALLEVLGKFQLKGAEAGTKARGVILKLQKAQLGYQSGIFNINDAIDEANKKMALLTSAKQKDAFASKIFGAENITAGKIILNNKALFEEYTKGVTGTNMAYKQAEINTASFSVKLQELRARFENLIIKGNENSKTLNKFAKVIDFVTRNLDKILVIVGLVISAFAAYYAIMTTIRIATVAYNIVLGLFYAAQAAVPIALGASSIALKSYTIGMKIASVATKAWAGAQWLINAALTANPIGIIIVAIAALITGIILLIKYWDKVKAKIDEWSNSAVFQILSLMMPILKIIELISFMQDRWAGIKKAFSEGGFIEGIKAIGKAILSFMLKPIEVILNGLSKIPGLGFAKKGAELISNFRADLDKDLLTGDNKPVNTQAATSEVQTRNIQEMQNNLAIELTNKTDKDANIKSNSAKIPITTDTY